MLPADMLIAFNVVNVQNDSQRIAIHLEEKIPESISSVDYYESKVFSMLSQCATFQFEIRLLI